MLALGDNVWLMKQGNDVEAKKQPLALGFTEGKTPSGDNKAIQWVFFLWESPPTGVEGSWRIRVGVGRTIRDTSDMDGLD